MRKRFIKTDENRTLRILLLVLVAGCLLFFGKQTCRAEGITGIYTEENAKTGYRVVIEDEADLLTEVQKEELAKGMKDITTYGNVAFITTDSNRFSAEYYAGERYGELFGTQSGTLFLIDMENRMLWIHSDGAVNKVITTAYANTITDNVYRDATDGQYYECATEVYREIFTLLEGNRIAQPMKYISNGLLAMILALLLNFGLVCLVTKPDKPGRKEMLRNVKRHFFFTKPVAKFSYQTKEYDPVSSGSSGSSSGGSRGSSGGGRSGGSSSRSSGSGGGHRF